MFNPTSRFMLLLVCLALPAFLARLGGARIVTSHEARLAATAATMAQSGLPWAARPVAAVGGPENRRTTRHVNPWLIPVFEGQVRLQKPPLPYWATAALFLALGPSEWAARLLPALMGLAGALLLFGLARDLAGRRTARWAALVWVSTFFVVDEYRKAMADPYLAFFTLSAAWAWVRLARTSAPPPQAHGKIALALAFYLSLALGLLAKGPVLLFHVAVPIVLYTLLYRRRPSLSWKHHALGGLLVLLITLPWPLYVLARVPGALELWRFESVGEFTDNLRNVREWYFYLPALLQICLPWTPLWLAGLVLAAKRRRPNLLLPALWSALVVLFFSFVHMKKNAYLLPVMPAMALLVGQVLTLALAWGRRKLPGAWPKLLLDAQATLGIVLGIGIAVLLLIGPLAPGQRLPLLDQLHRLLAQGAGRALSAYGLAALLALTAALYPLHRPVSRTLARRAFTQVCVYSILICLVLSITEIEKRNRRAPVVNFEPQQTQNRP